jgi:hypothetical protein
MFSFPRGTEMFHFPRYRSIALCIQATVSRHYARGVAPFGNPRIKICLLLPEAYRSLPRPSSPTDAKASIVRPFALDQIKTGLSIYMYLLSSNSRWNLFALSLIVKDQYGLTADGLATDPLPPFRTTAHRSQSRDHVLAPPGGRDWSRTSDLVLIRDTL